MNQNYYHGPRMSSSVDSTTATPIVATSPVGVVITGDAADAALFPLNEAVSIAAFDAATLAAVGATGTAASVLKSLSAQGVAPTTTVVRVEEDAADLETNVALGLEVLKEASTQGESPLKLFGAPGLESVAIAAELAVIAADQGGFSYAAIQGAAAMSDAVVARASYGHKNTMLLWPATVLESGDTVHAAALALGQRVFIDNMAGGGIAKTISNVAMAGIDDIGIPMNYKGEQSTANQLNKHHITTIIRRNGFRFWGNRTASSEPMFTFETDVRIAHHVDSLIEVMMDEDIDEITDGDALEDVVYKGQILLDNLARGEDAVIIDGKFWIDGDLNDESVLASGAINFNYDFGTAKPLEQPHFDGRITNKYLLSVLPTFDAVADTTQV